MLNQELTPVDSSHLLAELEALRAENARLKALAAGASHEIEQRKVAEEALRHSEERFKAQFRFLPMPTYIWRWNGADLVLEEFNDAADVFTQRGVRNFIGQTAREMYHDNPAVLSDLLRCIHEKSTFKRQMAYLLHSTLALKELVVTYVHVPPDLVMVHTDDITESKRAHDSLRESEERYRALFEGAPVGLGVANERGELLAFNDAIMKPGGYTREDIVRIGNVGGLYSDPAERDTVLALARKQGFLHAHEVRFRRKDGSSYIARLSLQPITLNGQRGWQAMAEDITDRKQAEAALKESEERLRLALDAGAMGLWHWDMRTGKLDWSEQHARIFGVDPTKFDGNYESFEACVHPDDRARIKMETELARSNRTPIQTDFRIVWPDGSTRWVSSRGQFSYDSAGDAVHITGLVMDITRRKLAEAQLQKSEASLREAQRIASVGHWEWDLEHTILSWSEELYRILGRPVNESPLTYEAYMEIVHPDDRERVKRAVSDALAGHRPYSIENRIIWSNGEVRHIHAQGHVFYSADGTPVRMSGTAMDMTERKQLEAHLLQAQKIESVGRLAGGVAHDFNNLLTGIMGYTELLAMKLVPELKRSPELLEDLEGIRQTALRAANLTRQLLGFARKQNIEPKVINPNDLIANLGGMMIRLIGEQINLVTIPKSGLGHVKIDPGQFEQILINLAVNARDAMPQGGTLTVQTENFTLEESTVGHYGCVAAGEYVLVCVSDTGVGMSEDIQRHLFEPFFTTKEHGKGTGLGLATCYGIAKQHHGHIWGESTPGRGATFKLILPVVPMPEVIPRKAADAVIAHGNELVLLVEDEPTVRTISASTLRSAGYSVLEAADGRDALQMVERCEKPIDILITDVVMPRLGGRELAEQLRAKWSQLRILYISGYTKDEIIHDETDCVAFQQKPFTPETLLRRARELLDAPRKPAG